MRCPRCESSKLDEHERDGILLDVCRSCRGMWLDHGELEKLIARATREADELEDRDRDDETPRGGVSYRDDAPAPGARAGDDPRAPRRKRSWLASIGDIFD